MSLRRLTLLTVALTMVTVGCGISGSGRAERIDPVPLGLGDTIAPSTTTTSTTLVPGTTVAQVSTTDDLPTTSTIPTELVSVYFISASGLYPVKIPLPTNPGGDQVLAVLAAGPQAYDQLGAGLRSVIPNSKERPLVFNNDQSGVATIDLPPNFFESMLSSDQRFAYAQIVLTVISNIKGIGQVRFTVNGAATAVLDGNGVEVAPGTPVSLRNYINLVGSTPPSTTTTTTTTTATTAATTIPAPTSTAAPDVVAETTISP